MQAEGLSIFACCDPVARESNPYGKPTHEGHSIGSGQRNLALSFLLLLGPTASQAEKQGSVSGVSPAMSTPDSDPHEGILPHMWEANFNGSWQARTGARQWCVCVCVFVK